jgi:hypothetical protein
MLRARGSRVSSRMGPERKPEQRRAACVQEGAALSSRGGVYRSRKPRAYDACGYRRAFSCQRRCPRCHQKRVLA